MLKRTKSRYRKCTCTLFSQVKYQKINRFPREMMELKQERSRAKEETAEIREWQEIWKVENRRREEESTGKLRTLREPRLTTWWETNVCFYFRHHHHHHHSRYRKYSLQDDLVARTRAGSDISPSEISRKNSIQPEEASLLDEVDVENLESESLDNKASLLEVFWKDLTWFAFLLTGRRFDDLRRYKVPLKNSSLSVIRIGRKDGDKMENVVPLGSDKKMIDHSPHEVSVKLWVSIWQPLGGGIHSRTWCFFQVFVQLDELCGVGEEREWKETARWIKYEEDVEEGADRWGQPHVASLSFHSLLNLRRCLETGRWMVAFVAELESPASSGSLI